MAQLSMVEIALRHWRATYASKDEYSVIEAAYTIGDGAMLPTVEIKYRDSGMERRIERASKYTFKVDKGRIVIHLSEDIERQRW